MMIIGDFNGHVGFFGEQKVEEGNITLSWMEKYNSKLLNNDTNCKGMHTWEGRQSKSVIDSTLTNSQLYVRFKGMVTDDEKALIHLIDHSILLIRLKKIKMTKKEITEDVRETEG